MRCPQSFRLPGFPSPRLKLTRLKTKTGFPPPRLKLTKLNTETGFTHPRQKLTKLKTKTGFPTEFIRELNNFRLFFQGYIPEIYTFKDIFQRYILSRIYYRDIYFQVQQIIQGIIKFPGIYTFKNTF